MKFSRAKSIPRLTVKDHEASDIYRLSFIFSAGSLSIFFWLNFLLDFKLTLSLRILRCEKRSFSTKAASKMFGEASLIYEQEDQFVASVIRAAFILISMGAGEDVQNSAAGGVSHTAPSCPPAPVLVPQK
jgi:hypothetical protein